MMFLSTIHITCNPTLRAILVRQKQLGEKLQSLSIKIQSIIAAIGHTVLVFDSLVGWRKWGSNPQPPKREPKVITIVPRIQA